MVAEPLLTVDVAAEPPSTVNMVAKPLWSSFEGGEANVQCNTGRRCELNTLDRVVRVRACLHAPGPVATHGVCVWIMVHAKPQSHVLKHM